MTDQTAASSPAKDDAGQSSTNLSDIISAAMDDAGVQGSVFADAPAKPAEASLQKPHTDTPSAAETAAAGKPEDGKPSPDKTPKVAAERKTEDAAGTKAPDHWDAQTRDAFGKLPEDARQILLRIEKGREAAATRRNQELAADRKFATEVRSILTDDHRAQLQKAGMTEVQGFQRLLEYQDFARRAPDKYVRWIVAEAKLDPKQVFPELLAGGQPAPNGAQPQVPPAASPPPVPRPDPHVNQLLETVSTLRDWAMHTEEQRAQNEVARFRNEKDAAGNPLHPHLDAVEEEVARLLTEDSKIAAIQNPYDRLKRAYEVAVYADQDIRAQIVDAEAAKRAAANRQRDDVTKARNARSPVSAPAQTTPASFNSKSLEDTVAESMRRAGF